ncbi:MAG: hypothetical protein RLZZ488_913 [Pseudomonadota bacterium]|jgi:PmbA protein
MAAQMDVQSLVNSIARARPEIRFDISGSGVEDQTVKIKEDESLDQSASQRTNATLRVWNTDGRVGVVQITSLEQNEILNAIDVALESAALGPADSLPELPVAVHAESLPALSASASAPVPLHDLSDSLLAGVRQLKGMHADITGVPYNAVSQRRMDRFYANSDGLIRRQSGGSVSTYLYARGQAQGHKPRAAGHWNHALSLPDLNIGDVAKTAGELLVSHLHPVKIQSGQYPVVFSGHAFLDLLDAFSNLFNAQNILDQQSLHSKESLGTSVASPLLSVSDDPLHPLNVSPALFDGEGTAVRRTVLLDRGSLTGLWHHSVSAKVFNAGKTGHARVGAKMSVGPWFYNVAAGNGLGNAADDCIWIDELEALHAGVNPLQGSFSLPFLGYRQRNGKRESLEGVTVAGDILTLLQSITAVDNKQERASGGVCPAIAVSSLSITCEG